MPCRCWAESCVSAGRWLLPVAAPGGRSRWTRLFLRTVRPAFASFVHSEAPSRRTYVCELRLSERTPWSFFYFSLYIVFLTTVATFLSASLPHSFCFLTALLAPCPAFSLWVLLPPVQGWAETCGHSHHANIRASL